MREELSDVFRNPLVWVAAGAAFCISAGAILLAPRPKEPVSQVAVAPPMREPDVRIAERPVSPQAVPAAPPVIAEEIPPVKIRSVPPRTPQPGVAGNTPGSQPELNAGESVAGSMQGVYSGEPGDPALPPLDNQRVPLPGELVAPSSPVPPVITAPIEPPPATEPAREIAPPVTPARQPERAAQRLRQPTGLLTIFFDADSTTFDRDRRRMPLRVEVWVDGNLKARSNDPEKRDVEVGLLPAGWHEVEVVPYVGNLPSQPRRRSVLIEPGATAEFRAVLRREDGMGCVTKFRPRG